MNVDCPLLIIVDWNLPQECIGTVAAFAKQFPNLRIVVLDNHSEHGALEILRANLDSIEILPLPEKKGRGPAINVGLRRWLDGEKSAYCLISAHDAKPGAGCVQRLLAATDHDPKIGIASPEYPDGNVLRLSALRGVAQEIDVPLQPGDVREIDVPHGPPWLCAANVWPRSVSSTNAILLTVTNMQLCLRARRHGWKLHPRGRRDRR